VCPHFGSAPGFAIVDTETGACRTLANAPHEHMCGSLDRLQQEKVDSLIVGGIGMGALNRLMAAGMRVFLAEHTGLDETVAAFKNGQLRPVTPDFACAGHGGGGHGHHHRGGGGCRSTG
jgi:predicted Fe-Mo cluster-binding NifX family protein